jgi:hypothetical protein
MEEKNASEFRSFRDQDWSSSKFRKTAVTLGFIIPSNRAAKSTDRDTDEAMGGTSAGKDLTQEFAKRSTKRMNS